MMAYTAKVSAINNRGCSIVAHAGSTVKSGVIQKKTEKSSSLATKSATMSKPKPMKPIKPGKFGRLLGPDANLYPEWGALPWTGEKSVYIDLTDEKNIQREVIHGRWAMLAVAGAWAAEVGTGIPWWKVGELCTPDDCTALAKAFPGAYAPIAPEGSGYPSFWLVLFLEIFLVGSAEGYRTGLFDNPFPELDDEVGQVYPGGRFDPLGFAEAGDIEELKVKELKHCRLAMGAWLGLVVQSVVTKEGPVANWFSHCENPWQNNILGPAITGLFGHK